MVVFFYKYNNTDDSTLPALLPWCHFAKNLSSVTIVFALIFTPSKPHFSGVHRSCSGLCIHCGFRTYFSVIFVFSAQRKMIFPKNLTAKSTKKVKHFFAISLIGNSIVYPWIAWLSMFHSLFKSICHQKIKYMWDLRLTSLYDAKTRRENQSKQSEHN